MSFKATSETACLRDGPNCRDVLHNRVPVEVWEEALDRRRLVRVRIAPEYLTQMLNAKEPVTGFIYEIESNLPADARVLFVKEDHNSPALVAFVHSKEFDAAPPFAEVPEFSVQYTQKIVGANV